ncbi:hypothetical protein WS98_12320 [Burkholderia territorii]|nr:hypothetical protein WS98_12320 [Burkholderia territorii]
MQAHARHTRDMCVPRAARCVGQTIPKSSLLSGIDASSRSSRYQPITRRHRAAKADRALRGAALAARRAARDGEAGMNAARGGQQWGMTVSVGVG